jgi:hypothetical protein
VVRPLGAGGIREVYLARDTKLGREVALKVMVTAAILVLSAAAAPGAAAAPQIAGVRQGAPTQPVPKPKKPPSAKLAQPWPDAGKLAGDRREAEARRLFQQSDALIFTLTADFKAVNRDRDPASTKTFPAVLTTAGPAGASPPLKVTLRTRGNLRLNPRTCAFAPLAVTFVKKDVAETAFDGQSKLKLVTHCQNDDRADQLVLREVLAYRLHNLLTPRSFRVRLARATYVDAASGKTVATRNAFFIEDEDDVARRMEGRALSLPRMQFSDFEPESLTQMMLFQYLIGNTDFSIYELHNVAMVATPAKLFYPIAWDFDVTGLVDPPYGIPTPVLGIASIRERLYRGPCRTLEEFGPSLAIFRAKQAGALALVDSIQGFDPRDRRDASAFLGEFFSLLGSTNALKRELVDKCRKQPTM